MREEETAAGTGVGLAMPRVETVLDAWWNLAGFLSGGVLGLFMLGLISRRAGPAAGKATLALRVAVAVGMTRPKLFKTPALLRNPWDANMTIVLGTLTIFLVGLLVAALRPCDPPSLPPPSPR